MNRIEGKRGGALVDISATRAISAPPSLVLVSNRGPVEYHRGANGALQVHRGSGGVVTALSAAAARVAGAMPVTWVAAPMTEGDRLVAAADGNPMELGRSGLFDTKFVTADREAYHLHYNVFCNPFLWFFHHGLQGLLSPAFTSAQLQQAWREGYVTLNERFGQAVVEVSARHQRPLIMLQDYHLYLTAPYVKARLPHARVSHFVHVPWPDPRHWRLVPAAMRRAIFAGLCAADLVGLQSTADADRFLTGCAAFLEGAVVDRVERRVQWAGHQTAVGAYSITIDCADLKSRLSTPETHAYLAKLRPLSGECTIVRVDRLDPSKNIVRGFQALHLLLEARPELIGRLRMLAFLVPSRTEIPEYRACYAEVMASAAAVNARFSRGDWQPVELFYEDNCEQAISAMTMYDVLLVNPVADGMNLVAKEGPTVNQRNGVLILSNRAGAHEQLSVGALTIDPFDVPGTAKALARAIDMPGAERAARQARLRAAIERYDISEWLRRQIEYLAGPAAETLPIKPEIAAVCSSDAISAATGATAEMVA